MLWIKRGIVNISLFPIGSSYRFRIPLPNSGECWFTADHSQNVSSVLQEIKSEDSGILEILSENPSKPFKDAAEEGLLISINTSSYLLKKAIQPSESKPTLNLFIEKLEQSTIVNKSELNSFVASNLAQIGEQFGNYLSVLKDSVNEIDLQIQALNHKEQQIMKKVRQRSNFFCSIGFTFLVSQ